MSVTAVLHKVENGLELAGKLFVKGLSEVIKYEKPVSALAALIFPAQTAEVAGVVSSVDLIQKAVVEIEQKYAASGVAKSPETSAQKLADVTALVSPTVIALLAAEGISFNTSDVQNIINAVVAVLKVQVVAA